MKITYNSSKSAPGASGAPAWFRHLVLAWFLAAAVEYLLLPEELRILTELSGLAEMSLTRLLLVTAAAFGLLTAVDRVLPKAVQRLRSDP